MAPDVLEKLERLVRKLAASRWPKFAILRARARRQWLDDAIERLYAASRLDVAATLSRERADEILTSLREMEGHLNAISRAVPFDRKVPALLRPFTCTFQQIVRLRNATVCGIAAMRLRLEGPVSADLTALHLPAADILDARERILAFAPGWVETEMDLYDHI